MALMIDDLPAAIRQAKQELRARLPNYRDVFAEVDETIRAEASRIAAQRSRGENVIPEIQFSDIADSPSFLAVRPTSVREKPGFDVQFQRSSQK